MWIASSVVINPTITRSYRRTAHLSTFLGASFKAFFTSLLRQSRPSRMLPDGFQAHQESTTEILTPLSNSDQPPEAFINPVQEYNRDLSIAAIRAWSSIRECELRTRWLRVNEKRQAKRIDKRRLDQTHSNDIDESHPLGKKHKGDENPDQNEIPKAIFADTTSILQQSVLHLGVSQNTAGNVAFRQAQVVEVNGYAKEKPKELEKAEPAMNTMSEPEAEFVAPKFTALEALSATGLRAIRYAKEIPSMKWIIANDLSASAVKIIKENVRHNQLESVSPEDPGRVRVNQGDACDVMYSHRPLNRQFDLVDLDPYGTAAPFMDAAVQCIRDGGILCVTCTDLAVLAGSAYPEKCFANYGGSSLRAEFSHEYALRQVIHALSTSAARYGKYIKPLLSLSIDFYVRIFVRVYNSPVEVKKCITNTGLVYVCASCSSHHLQHLGRSSTKSTKSGKGVNTSYHNQSGPPVSGSQCEECGGKLHVAGPLWTGPLHDDEFLTKILEQTDPSTCGLKTVARIKGMVSIAKTELVDSLFFFTPTKLSGLFHCTSPPLTTVASAILNAGYQVSRSHCQPGSIKTDAPRSFLHDIMRKWTESNPVKMANVKEGSPSWVLLSKPISSEVSLEFNPEVEKRMMTDIKLVRYQSNPLPNWGPKSRARAH